MKASLTHHLPTSGSSLPPKVIVKVWEAFFSQPLGKKRGPWIMWISCELKNVFLAASYKVYLIAFHFPQKFCGKWDIRKYKKNAVMSSVTIFFSLISSEGVSLPFSSDQSSLYWFISMLEAIRTICQHEYLTSFHKTSFSNVPVEFNHSNKI